MLPPAATRGSRVCAGGAVSGHDSTTLPWLASARLGPGPPSGCGHGTDGLLGLPDLTVTRDVTGSP